MLIAATRSTIIAAVLTVLAAASIAATFNPQAADEARTLVGPAAPVGAGTAQSFIDLDAAGRPTAIGITLTQDALDGLPSRMNTTSRCFDKDASGHFAHGECLGDYQTDIDFPAEAQRLGIPVKWGTVNWNPEGHLEPAPPVWSAAHFDFHFFLVDRAVIDAIRPGPCGEFIHCDDFATATAPLPAPYMPPDYVNVGAAVPTMGNHLVDSKDPEIADPSLGFSRTFIFGAYGGRLIFLEPMVSMAHLESRPQSCTPLKAPLAWETAGYYPTRYCVNYDAENTSYRISLEGLVRREG